MEKEKKCQVCTGSVNLVFSCSGAADVGGVADMAARRLSKEGIGKMYCLAGVGGDVEGIVATTKKADKILAIDGCAVECTRKLLENKGFKGFEYIQLETMGLVKGKTEMNEENIAIVFEKGKTLLA